MYGTGQHDVLERAKFNEAALGTRFLLYPQVPHVPGYAKPEPVWISRSPDQLRTGPEDDQIYVCDPVLPKEPYEFPALPPYVGSVFPPAEAGPDGHFDAIDVASRQFVAAHAYAAVRRVLDIWENYLGKPIVWHFAETYERLEIIPMLDWHNAQSGYGYLELGRDRGPDGRTYPFALNFDVIAHEIGHSILFSLFNFPASGPGEGDFAPIHEASADVISLLSFLHFDSAVDRLLRNCSGNLLVLNELNRIAELTADRQIRLACNTRRLSEVSEEVHDRSRPLTGAIFDTLVDEFHKNLVLGGLAEERLLSIDLRNVDGDSLHAISRFTANAFKNHPFLFKTALVQARDEIAVPLALAWTRLDANNMTFKNVADAIVSSTDKRNPPLAARFEANFWWREFY